MLYLLLRANAEAGKARNYFNAFQCPIVVSKMASATEKIKESIAEMLDSGTHISIASTTEKIAKKLGLNERLVHYTHIELRNKMYEWKYKKTPVEKRILFLPHCLRHPRKCKAKYNSEGLQCEKCGNCKIKKLVELAEKSGWQGVFVCPGGSMVKELVKKYKPQAVLGVCCYNEAKMAFENFKNSSVAPQAVLLLRDGCVNTDVNIDEVREKMELIERKKNAKGD